MGRTIRLLAVCLSLIAVAAAALADAEREAPKAEWKSRPAGTPRGVRTAIQLGGQMLARKGAVVLRNGKPVLGVWFPKKVAKPNALQDGRLIAILSGPGSSDPHSVVTVRTIERGYTVAFSTIELERADRELLLTVYPLDKWQTLGPTVPLALVRPEDLVWDDTDLAKVGAAAYGQDGEVQVMIALLPKEKRGLRWALPERIRRTLGL
jgi:hypothetical protein